MTGLLLWVQKRRAGNDGGAWVLVLPMHFGMTMYLCNVSSKVLSDMLHTQAARCPLFQP